MAFRDYITCGECETKIIYDGYDNGRDRLEKRWGDPNANSWTVHLLCPDCIKKMRADLAAARAERNAAQMDAAKTGEREAVYLSRIQHLMSELEAARALLQSLRSLVPEAYRHHITAALAGEKK